MHVTGEAIPDADNAIDKPEAVRRAGGKEAATMKSLWVVAIVLVVIVLAAPSVASQKPANSVTVPKYDPAAEATFKGTVVEVIDRQCPVSGGMGSHVIMKLADGSTIEVHLATTKWVKEYDLTLNKGDEIEVKGVKVKFEAVDTIFAREVTRGNDVFVFRDEKGKPVW
jgi:heme/copper-type cytochrome/quinol oxidase subunit 2